MPDDTAGPGALRAPRGGPAAYAAAVAGTVALILSQYVVPGAIPALRPVYGTLATDLLLVYGGPTALFLLLVGGAPIRRFVAGGRIALREGFRWYGLFSLAAFAITLVVLVVFLGIDPGAAERLTQPSPDLRAAAQDPWLWVALSIPVGLAEETIFRGWIFGYWVARGTRRWPFHAIWTSLLFAGVHVYYATTYGVAVVAIVPTLVLLGLAFAWAYHASGGNLLVVGLLHGAYDASAFLTLLSLPAGELLRFGPVVVGLAVALALRARGPAGRPSRPVTLL